MTSFNLSEEAFILSSLNEVVRVWARGYGQASFNLNIKDGVADLQLGFQLGHPADPHLHQQSEPHHHLPPEHHPNRKKKRRKGPARRESDRVRAEQHRARFQPEAAAASSFAEEQTGAVALKLPVVLLPITGKLLSVKPATPTPSNATAAAPAATPPPPHAPPPSVAAATTLKTLESNSARKHLFLATPSNQKPIPKTLPVRQAYKKKEYELWTRLFK